MNLRLTLEVLHNIQKAVINIGLIVKLDLDLVKIGQRVLLMRILR